MKCEASSLFADSAGCNMRKTCNKLPEKFNNYSSNYEINTKSTHFEVD